jgi:hypothetical protein
MGASGNFGQKVKSVQNCVVNSRREFFLAAVLRFKSKAGMPIPTFEREYWVIIGKKRTEKSEN